MAETKLGTPPDRARIGNTGEGGRRQPAMRLGHQPRGEGLPINHLARGRLAALGASLAALVAYGAVAAKLPELPSGVDVAFHSALVFPFFAAAIWLALPLARGSSALLAVAAVTAGAAALVLSAVDLGSGANVAKLACYALVGFWFLTLFEELWWVTLITLVVPWADI